ncbi:MAG: hypothetical protein JW709_04035 [Sedimentisphaerales bacterium]|nr:hypothetical protein [Sedimentisphaerales bacterium]
MQQRERNRKRQQQINHLAYLEAEQALADLHKLLSEKAARKESIGKTVSLAARAGVLRRRPVGVG